MSPSTRADSIRDRIMSAAKAEFALRGIAGAWMDRIAMAADRRGSMEKPGTASCRSSSSWVQLRCAAVTLGGGTSLAGLL
ncbi:hypothetical protein OG542_21935 [Streptomyces violaceus]|uniref:hypothetical protein n=1 Tax=Streptomyces violaceus TaxID=1936 RepID=UPI002E24365E